MTVQALMTKVFKFNVPDGKEVDAKDIAKMLGISVSELPAELLDKLLKETKAVQEQKIAIRHLINPFFDELMKDKKKNRKKILELIDIGKFIYHYAKDIVLTESVEKPDFVVEFEGERIGIEHTQLFNDNAQHTIGKITSLLEVAKGYILGENESVKGLFNIFIDTRKIVVGPKEFIDLSKIELRPFARRLANYITSLYEERSIDLPDFVLDVIRYDQDTLHLGLSERFIKEQLHTEALLHRIDEKESRINAYKENKKLKTCWLLVMYSSSISSSSFYVDPSILPNDKVLFDKIFLFDSFRGTIIEGKVIR
ncbi:MAG: hypothetical protein WDM78_07810 [Puia sp.]